VVATLETKNVCIAEDFAEEIGLSYGQYVNHRVSKVSRNNTKICSLLNPTSFAMCRACCTFLKLVEHHSKESTVHRFEPARPRNRAQHIAANTE
jgi:hypothetical protein